MSDKKRGLNNILFLQHMDCEMATEARCSSFSYPIDGPSTYNQLKKGRRHRMLIRMR